MGEFDRLPSRFPVGTRYVIEGRGGRISLRYLEFPDGRKIDLPADLAARSRAARSKARARAGHARQTAAANGSKKNLNRRGTARGVTGC
jgi:hypothetical protein